MGPTSIPNPHVTYPKNEWVGFQILFPTSLIHPSVSHHIFLSLPNTPSKCHLIDYVTTISLVIRLNLILLNTKIFFHVIWSVRMQPIDLAGLLNSALAKRRSTSDLTFVPAPHLHIDNMSVILLPYF